MVYGDAAECVEDVVALLKASISASEPGGEERAALMALQELFESEWKKLGDPPPQQDDRKVSHGTSITLASKEGIHPFCFRLRGGGFGPRDPAAWMDVSLFRR